MDTEKKILDATLSVIRKRTIAGTRMREIADESGLVLSNIHYYYPTKEELLEAVQNQVLSKCLEIREDLREQGGNDTLEERLDVFIGQKKNFLLENQDYDFAELDFWNQSRISKAVRDRFADSYARWRKEIETMLAECVPDLPEDILSELPTFTVSFLEGATVQYLIDPEAMDIDAYFEFGKKILLGIVAPYRQVEHENNVKPREKAAGNVA